MNPKFLISIFLASTMVVHVMARSNGAPDEACLTMTPKHTGTYPQRGVSPFVIDLDLNKVLGGSKVTVRIQGATDTFQGFMLAAQKLNISGLPSEAPVPYGSFEQTSNTKLLSCGQKQGSAVTHINNQAKREHRVEWIAPNEEGDYVILLTVVKDFATYWVKQRSEPIKVRRDYQSEDGTENQELDHEAGLKINDFASGCGKTKGCFGIPEGCLQKDPKSCEMFTTFRKDGSNFLFQIAGKLPMPGNEGHVSVGLSFDNKMGQDSVTGCVMQGQDVRAKSYYNLPGEGIQQNAIMPDEYAGLDHSFRSGTYLGGILFCEFARTPVLDTHELQRKFDLNNDKYNILLARAPSITKTRNGEKLGYHPNPTDRFVSSIQYSLSQTQMNENPQPGSGTGGKDQPKGKGSSNRIAMTSFTLILGVFVTNFCV